MEPSYLARGRKGEPATVQEDSSAGSSRARAQFWATSLWEASLQEAGAFFFIGQLARQGGLEQELEAFAADFEEAEPGMTQEEIAEAEGAIAEMADALVTMREARTHVAQVRKDGGFGAQLQQPRRPGAQGKAKAAAHRQGGPLGS